MKLNESQLRKLVRGILKESNLPPDLQRWSKYMRFFQKSGREILEDLKVQHPWGEVNLVDAAETGEKSWDYYPVHAGLGDGGSDWDDSIAGAFNATGKPDVFEVYNGAVTY